MCSSDLTGLEPWVLFGESAALSAHAQYAAGDDVAAGRRLFLSCRESALRVFGAPIRQLDYPAAGQLLFGLGAWVLLRRPASGDPGPASPASVGPASASQVPAEAALRLLALADRFAYNRTMPTMMWERILPAAEEAAPGLLAAFRGQYRDRQPPDLVGEACRLAERLPGSSG